MNNLFKEIKEILKLVFHKYIFVLFGFGFGIYSFYLSFTGDATLFKMLAMFAGFMLAFVQADRNVYHDRLESLARAIDDVDMDIDVERFDYTEYTITILGKTGSSDTEKEDVAQKTLDDIEH